MTNQLINNLALAAALVTLLAGLWQGWSSFAIVKRLLTAYLAFFLLGALLALVVRAGALWDGRSGREERPRRRAE